jgi:hypothetical protein
MALIGWYREFQIATRPQARIQILAGDEREAHSGRTQAGGTNQ